jgi:YebC/PmpR family DNA-binding regulatory protein
MAGHSKWANIKHRKGASDKKRAVLFTKLAKNITVAAREGGDPNFNFKLRTAIDKALAGNMPKDNIDRAIKKGTGETDGGNIEEVLYEGYGPGGVAIIIEALTDNRHRTSANIKSIFNKNEGNFAASGAVQWMFNKKGVVYVKESVGEDVQLGLIDAGAEDIKEEDGMWAISCAVTDLGKVRDAAESAGLTIDSFGLEWRAKESGAELDKETQEKVMTLFEALDEDEDVSELYSNAEFA